METNLLFQASELASAFAAGIILGFIYDVLKVPRHLAGAWGFIFDIIFCLLMAGGLFLLGMALGGEVDFYMLLAAMGGAAIYWMLFGFFLAPLFGKAENFGAKSLLKLKKLIKKLNKNIKNIFSFLKKRFRMVLYIKNDKLGKCVSKSGASEAQRKGTYDENSGSENSKVYYPDSFGLCPHKSERCFGEEEQSLG
ncbi:MAG: spore cortex biosynthesis protein YabQ [Oscillospiraceae bacterium]|nr:spore cortex biosynthesis protein YabQ [Oscillospiraceae bacterium]